MRKHQPFLMPVTATASLTDTANRLIAAERPGDALALVARASMAGDPEACFLSGLWRLIGSPCPRDLPAARQWLSRAAGHGHVGAGRMLVALTANGTGGPADWDAARALLMRLAETDPESARQVATLDENRGPAVENLLATHPSITIFRNFASDAECTTLRDSVADIIAPTMVIDPQTGRQIAHPIRTSDGAVIGPTRESLVIQNVSRRIAEASGTDRLNGEPVHILRYRPGQQYRPHFDAVNGAANQRILTAILYLNDDFGGGETDFPQVGARVRPEKGALLLFSNCLVGGQPDRMALHAGLPVTRGEKWIATRWIRARRYDPWNPY